MITTANANNILKLYFAQIDEITGSGKCYLGLSTEAPNADGSNFIEPSSATTGYQRAQINIGEAMEYTNMMSVPSNGAIENIKEIVFPEALAPYRVTHFGVFGTEAVGSGTPLYVHALTAPTASDDGTYAEQPVDVDINEVLLFRQGALSLSFVQD